LGGAREGDWARGGRGGGGEKKKPIKKKLVKRGKKRYLPPKNLAQKWAGEAIEDKQKRRQRKQVKKKLKGVVLG